MIRISVPKSLGIIPDGNRRFAKRLLEKPGKGHEWGIEKLKRVMDWCRELDIRNVTFYTLSLENIDRRPKEELALLFSLARKELNEIVEDPKNWTHETKTKVVFFGQIHRLPEDLQESISKVIEKTKDYDQFSLNLAIAYGGRQEIIDAVKKIADEVSHGKMTPNDIDERVIRHNLSTNGMPDPDLIIRTGGEKRISNFLPFQSTYSELVFMDTYWPELEKKEFVKAIHDFGERERRFGK